MEWTLISGTRPRAGQGRLAFAALAAILALAGLATTARAGVAPELAEEMADAPPGREIPVLVTLARQVDEGALAERPAALLRALRATAAESRGEVEAADGPVRHFWLVNALAVSATADEVRAIAADPDVERVDRDQQVRALDARAAAVASADPRGAWGLAAAGVPGAWQSSGARGEGVTVGVIDTGVTDSHPDLRGKVAAFRDFVNGRSAPYDDNGHGTHTLGTIVGGASGGAPIGVAPAARAVVAKAMDANGVGTGSDLLAAAQWLADPDGDPRTADQPAVINNSWSASGANDPWFRAMIRRWHELGIVPVFAAGNSGPGASTIGSPASYPEALAVGAISQSDAPAGFSSRGPVRWRDPDGLGPAAGTILTKPDLVAPGVGIVSSMADGYASYSGTSMAAPHVAGVVALVRQANPALGPEAVADIMRQSAADLGAPGPDDTFGAGRLDAAAAIQQALGPSPDTRLVRTPPPATRATRLAYVVSLSAATRVRYRVDGGAWSDPLPTTRVPVSLGEGAHVVELQAVADDGTLDPVPAAHRVTIDRTPPRVSFTWRRSGRATVFRARVVDRLSGPDRDSPRWRFAHGRTARGMVVSRRLGAGRVVAVRLTARDAAGNAARLVRRVGPRARGPVKLVIVGRRVSRGRGHLIVRARLSRAARVAVSLRPVGRARPIVARTQRARGTLRLALPLRTVAPGRYRLELRARALGPRASRSRVSRAVRVIG